MTWPIEPNALDAPVQDQSPVAPAIYIEPITRMEFAGVAGGCFDFGAVDGGSGRQACLDPFFIGRTEVTNAQFRYFRPAHPSGSYGGHPLDGPTQPVVNVSWQDATAYAEWLSDRTGERFRLPSEAEWEYALHAAGQDADPVRAAGANLRDGEGADPADSHPVTAPVARFPPNALGLYDMVGNASEWMLDNYVAGPDRYGDELTNPVVVVQDSPLRVRRGGSWDDTRSSLLSGFRDYYRGDLPVPQTGFRLVREAPPPIDGAPR